MPRVKTFTFRVDDYERELIIILASHLRRSQSDAIRSVIRLFIDNIGTAAETSLMENSSVKSKDEEI